MSKNQTYKKRMVPIEKPTRELYSLLIDARLTFQRDVRHTLWQYTVQEVRNMIGHIGVADNYPQLRESALSQFLTEFYKVSADLKMYNEKGFLTQKVYLQAFPLMDSIERQAKAWLTNTINARVGSNENGAAESVS